MRDRDITRSLYEEFYIDLGAWCNQPSLFKNMSFKDFIEERHSNTKRAKQSIEIYQAAESADRGEE